MSVPFLCPSFSSTVTSSSSIYLFPTKKNKFLAHCADRPRQSWLSVSQSASKDGKKFVSIPRTASPITNRPSSSYAAVAADQHPIKGSCSSNRENEQT